MKLVLVLVPDVVHFTASEPTKREHKSSTLMEKIHRVAETVSKHTFKGSKSKRLPHPSGFQILATCRQACAEGLAIFYSSNIFYLPPGPIHTVRQALNTLQPQLRVLAKGMSVRTGLSDLTPAVFEDIQQEMRERLGNRIATRPRAAWGTQLGDLVEKKLMSIWEEKIDFVLTHWGFSARVRAITLKNPGEEMEAEEEDMEGIETIFQGNVDSIAWVRWYRLESKRTAKLAGRYIEQMVNEDGWKAARAMARKGWPFFSSRQ